MKGGGALPAAAALRKTVLSGNLDDDHRPRYLQCQPRLELHPLRCRCRYRRHHHRPHFDEKHEIPGIAAAGGGFIVSASHKATDDLVRIAAAAKMSGAKVTLTGLSHKTTDDLVRIGAAGKGCVVLEG